MGFFDSIGDFFQDKIIDPVRDTIDPLLPESVKDNPLQAALAIGAAPFTGGASLAAMLPFAAESGLGQLGFDMPNWIPGLASGLMLPGTGATLPGFGAGGALSNLPGVSKLQGIPGIGGYFGGATTSNLFNQPLSAGGDFFQNILGGAKGGMGNIGSMFSGLLGGGGEGGFNIGSILGMLGAGGGGTGAAEGGTSGDTGGMFQPSAKRSIPIGPDYKSAQDIMDEALSYMQGKFPEAYGARESALKDMGNLDYYGSFQPTSLEQASADQYFQNNLNTVSREAKQVAARQGIGQIAPNMIMDKMSPVVSEIGQYLSGLGQKRAETSLSQRMGIDPASLSQPYANLDLGQSNAQQTSDYNVALQRAEEEYRSRLAKDTEQQGWFNLLGDMVLNRGEEGQGDISSIMSLLNQFGIGGQQQTQQQPQQTAGRAQPVNYNPNQGWRTPSVSGSIY